VGCIAKWWKQAGKEKTSGMQKRLSLFVDQMFGTGKQDKKCGV